MTNKISQKLLLRLEADADAPQALLDKKDQTAFYQSLDEWEACYEQAKQRAAESGYPIGLDEYDSIALTPEGKAAFYRHRVLRRKAESLFGDQYREYGPELFEAFRRRAKHRIVCIRDKVTNVLKDLRNFTRTEECQAWFADAENSKDPVGTLLEWTYANSLFSDDDQEMDSWYTFVDFLDDSLTEIIQESERLICNTMPEAYRLRVDQTLADFIRRKWSIIDELGAVSITGDDVTLINTYRAEYVSSPIHKLADVMATRPVIDMPPSNVCVRNAVSKQSEEVVSQLVVSLDADTKSNIFTNRHLTLRQIVTGDAVMSCVHEADRINVPRYITDVMIFRAMPGISDDPTSEQISGIREAMHALQQVRITYLADAEFAMYGLKSEAITDNYLSFVQHDGIDKYGHRIRYYDFTGRTPLLLDIALKTGQLITVPANVLAVPMKMNDEKQAIVRYLARRIARIIRPHKLSRIGMNERKIRLDTLCEYIEIGEPNNDKRKKLLKTIRTILDYWKSIGFIGSYTEYKDGRKVIGFEIESYNIIKHIND